jgi:hypothetical protein
MGCSPISAQFYGVPTQTLQTWLTNAQQALQDLTTGGKLEVAAYTQGDGSKSVTYTRANLGELQERINALAQALSGGQVGRRRPVRPLYL